MSRPYVVVDIEYEGSSYRVGFFGEACKIIFKMYQSGALRTVWERDGKLRLGPKLRNIMATALRAKEIDMSRESPSLDELFGAGTEAGEAEALNQSAIIDAVVAEREYQDKKWGHAFDDKNTVNDWAAYANIYLSNATTMKATAAEQRAGVLKAATLLIAALEAFDRNGGFPNRHYDSGI